MGGNRFLIISSQVLALFLFRPRVLCLLRPCGRFVGKKQHIFVYDMVKVSALISWNRKISVFIIYYYLFFYSVGLVHISGKD